MTMRRPQVVLIAFAIAAWLGAMFELGASARAGRDSLERATSCGDTYVDGARLLAPRGCDAVLEPSLESPTASYAH